MGPMAARYMVASIAALIAGALVFFDIPMRGIGVRKLIALVAALIAGATVFYLMPEPLPELTRAEFLVEGRAGHLRGGEIEDQEVIIADSSTRGKFRTDFHKDEDVNLPAELRGLGVEVWFSESPPGV